MLDPYQNGLHYELDAEFESWSSIRVMREELSAKERELESAVEARDALDGLRSELEEIQATSDLIATNSDINFDRFRIIHPVFGSNSPNQFFEILSRYCKKTTPKNVCYSAIIYRTFRVKPR